MTRVCDNVLATIGNTPLVQLKRVFAGLDLRVYAKLEGLNPGGSIKDRPAANIIQKAFQRGFIGPGSTVIESSSGNMGIGLAQICAYHKLRFICVVDPKTTLQNLAILSAFGAEIDLVSRPDPLTGEFLQPRLARVRKLVAEIPNSFWPDQYSNLENAEAHYFTMNEVIDALDGRVDHFFCATSTCGTLRGCVSYLRQHGLPIRVWAVDALGSVLFGGKKTRRLIPGHGSSLVPKLYGADLADGCVHVTDEDCIRGCRRLVAEEAILAGGSSGAVFSAFDKVKDRIAPGSTCVLMFADRGERYLDTIYSDAWVRSHFGDLVLGGDHELMEKVPCPIAAY